MFIIGDKIRLRPAQAADLPTIAKWGRDAFVNQHLEGDFPTSVEECSAWLKRIKSNRHAVHFVIETLSDRQAIGDIQLDHITWRNGDGELRIRIGEHHLWNQGFGTDAIQVMLEHAFGNMNLSCVYLRVFACNQRAIRCYEKAGFRKEGHLSRRSRDGKQREIYLMCARQKDRERIRRKKSVI